MKNLQTRIVMRNDTLDNWRSSNPVLMAGEWGIAIDSRTGKSVVKVGDGVHHWNDLSLELGKKEANTYSHSYAKGDYSTRDYPIHSAPTGCSHAEGRQTVASGNYAHVEGLAAVSKAVSAFGISATQAAEAMKNIMQAMQDNATLKEFQEYLDQQEIVPAEPRKEPARSQPKNLRSELRTLSSDIDEYNTTTVHSDAIFDF